MSLSNTARLCVLLGMLGTACFEPEPMGCLPCDPGCPSGETCVEGLCQTRAGECTLGANTAECGEQCCIDGACFDLQRHVPPGSLALWLDWTSLYEGQSAPIWRDRSAKAHRFTNDGAGPQLANAPHSGAKVLRFSTVGQFLALKGPEQFKLDNGDFLLLAAGALSCAAPRAAAKQCLVARFEEQNGLRLCAMLTPDEPSLIATCAQDAAAPTCASAAVAGVPCERMELLTLRRSSQPAADGGAVPSLVELRHNGTTQVEIELDPAIGLDAVGSLRIGGRAMQSFVGDLALVILITGPVGERETCELETFLLARLSAAGMPTATNPPACSPTL